MAAGFACPRRSPSWPAARALRVILALLVYLAFAVPAGAQDRSVDPATVARLDKAAADLQAAASGIHAPSTSDEALRTRLAEIPSIKASLAQALVDLTPRLQDADARLAQLGPGPGPGQPAEPPQTTTERASLMQARQSMAAEVKQANLLIVETAQTSKAIGDQLRTNFDTRLWTRSNSILDPGLAGALSESIANEMARVGAIFEAQERRTAPEAASLRGALILTLGAMAAVFLLIPARVLLNRLAYRFAPSDSPESRLRRSSLAIALVLVAVLTPLFAGLSVRSALNAVGGLNADFDALLVLLIRVVAVIGLVEGLGRALLSPGRPTWRLAPIPDDMARRLAPFPTVIAAAGGMALLVAGLDAALGSTLTSAVAGERLTVAVEIMAVGLALLTVMRGGGRAERRQESEPHIGSRLPWVLAALAAWLALLGALAAVIGGYLALASFLMRETIWIAVVLALLFLLIVFVDDLFPAALSPRARPGRLLRDGVGLQEDTLEHLAVLLSGLCRIGLLLFGAAAILLPYGTSPGDIVARVTSTQAEITLGQVSISPGAVFGSIALFLIGLAATRAVRGWLEVRYLPKTRMDLGARTSLAALFSYAGIAVALLLAFAYLGLTFSQITLLASALSVGIGFGLQSIIGNFVSGLILLVERPVKVGDWVAIGDLEGDIRAINIRATEIDMPDKSRLVVPNSELISKTVRNVTHAGAIGRIRIVLRLDGDADPIAVRDLVLGHLKAHPKVMTTPAPAVYFTDVRDGGLEFTGIAFVPSPRDTFVAKSDLLFQIVPDLRAKGFNLSSANTIVNVAFPDRSIEPAPPLT
jgi:potassium-dependent mechanosensitive channel